MSSGDLQRQRVILQSELAADLPTISGDRVQLQQVILNLLRNASDAMAGVDDRPRQLLLQTGRENDERVRLSVRDAGVGLDPETADKLFGAFFTTKSGGMGIGLFVSRSIIERHQGRLWAEPNEDGPGTTFSFSIPAFDRIAPGPGPGREHVVIDELPLVSIVDDDVSVRESLPDLAAAGWVRRGSVLIRRSIPRLGARRRDQLPPPRHRDARDVRPRPATGTGESPPGIPIIFITGQRRSTAAATPPRTRGRRVPVQAVQRGSAPRRARCRVPNEFGVTQRARWRRTRPYTGSSNSPIQSRPSACLASRSIVYVVDDDVSVRESLELLIKREGWQPSLFASAQDFLDHPCPRSCPAVWCSM